ncbi:ABC transporter ATP-binding protein [Paenibacillus sp. strain BS8-2]
MTLLSLRDASKCYKGTYTDTNVFSGLSLEVEEGDYLAVVGRSGGGKTSLLHIIGLLDPSFEGRLLFRGQDVRSLRAADYQRIRNEEIGFVFQNFRLIPELTVYENVEVPLAFSTKKELRRHKKERISHLLQELGLTGKEKAMPHELSGGQQQRVAIARALANEPALLIADEPTGNLDEASSHAILTILRDLNEKHGMTIVLVTHDPEVMSHADKVYELRSLIAAPLPTMT